jgi:hypothetical protein
MNMQFMNRTTERVWMIVKQCEQSDHSVDMQQYHHKIERLCLADEQYEDIVFELEYQGLIRREVQEDGSRLFVRSPWRCPHCGFTQQEPEGFEVEEVL